MPSSSDGSSQEIHRYLLQNQPIGVLGNDSWTPFPVCTGGKSTKYSALIITASFTEVTHYSYSFIVHMQRGKMSVINGVTKQTIKKQQYWH